MASFQEQILVLATAAGFEVSDLDDQRALIPIRVGDSETTQVVVVLDLGDLWEFSCLSTVREPSAEGFAPALLAFLLERNAQNARGFWCLQTVHGQKTLCYMHNVPPAVLTPDEFRAICESLVQQVESLETGYRLAAEALRQEEPPSS
ncbi:MAG: hypothetical protein K6U89_07820 [Chloroflexi bacterium]|nr:hypothetical protein [Chloroflexota bacterium]